MDDVKAKITELLRREGPQPIYRIAKALGSTYGAAQWHVSYLEREGVVKTYKVNGKRYVALASTDMLSALRVKDVLKGIEQILASLGAEPDAAEAIKELRRKDPGLAELLKAMADHYLARRARPEGHKI